MEVKKITRDTLISDLEISVRLQYGLINDWDRPQNPKRPATVGDFIDLPSHEFLRIPNLGRKSLIEWRNIVWAVENPDSPIIEENIVHFKSFTSLVSSLAAKV